MSETQPIKYVPPTAAWALLGNVGQHPSEAASQTPVGASVDRILGEGGWVFWNLADMGGNEIPLPSFITRQGDGYYADLEAIEAAPVIFTDFVNRVFREHFHFLKLDYPTFLKLAHFPEEVSELRKKLADAGLPCVVKFASEVVRLPDERRPLYRQVKISPKMSEATYFFEPLFIERTTVAPDAEGREVETKTNEPAKLDFDEFVAHLWNNGVRYGILESEVRKLIAEGGRKGGWEYVARQLDPIPGKDAEKIEVSDRLKQDTKPKMLEWGKLDLHQVHNFFPQVSEGEKMLEKIPRTLGKPGRNVAGIVLESPLPKDLDLNALSGPGTKIEEVNGRLFLIATMDGFLSDGDVYTVTENIVHGGGISARLMGKKHKLEGSIQEKWSVDEEAVIEADSIFVDQNVYGTLVSKTGEVVVRGNAVGAKIHAKGESVTVEGRVSNSVIYAYGAEVRLKKADTSVIFGKNVIVEDATNCYVVADYAEIGHSSGSFIGTKHVKINSSDSKNGVGTVVILEIPDVEDRLREVADKKEALRKNLEDIAQKKDEYEKIAAEYRALTSEEATLLYMKKRKEFDGLREKKAPVPAELAKFVVEQMTALRPKFDRIANLSKARKAYEGWIAGREEESSKTASHIGELETQIQEFVSGITVSIQMVTGETTVRARHLAENVPKLRSIENPQELRKAASAPKPTDELVFHESSGTFEWTYQIDFQN